MYDDVSSPTPSSSSGAVLLPSLFAMLVLARRARVAVAMQARREAVVVVVGAALVVVGGAALVVVVGQHWWLWVGQHWWWWWRGQRCFRRWRGEGERSRRMNVVILFLLRPLVGEKTPRSSAAIYMYMTESMINSFFFQAKCKA